MSVDPLMQFWSPYLAMGNTPTDFIDPNGGEGGPARQHTPFKYGDVSLAVHGTPLPEVLAIPSFWDFMDDLDAFFSGKIGIYISGKGGLNLGQQKTTGKEIISLDMETFNNLMSLHKEWKRFGQSRHDNQNLTYKNENDLERSEHWKEWGNIMERFYEALKSHREAHAGVSRVKAYDNYVDSLASEGIGANLNPHWIFGDGGEKGKDTAGFIIHTYDHIRGRGLRVDTVKFKK